MPFFQADNRLYRLVIIVFLALFGIFIRPFDPGTLDFIYRFIIFAAITFLLYIKWHKDLEAPDIDTVTLISNSSQKPVVLPESPLTGPWMISDLLENDEKSADFLRDQFELLGNFLFPETGWIFYQEESDRMFVFLMRDFSEKGITNEHADTPLSGILKILADGDRIVFENNLSHDSNLLPYHTSTTYVANSFVGIPINLSQGKRIYFTFDSQTKDHFNQDDRPLLEKFSRSIETFLVNRIKGYQLLRNLKHTEDLLRFAEDLNSCKTLSQAMDILTERVSKEFEATRLTLSIVSSEKDQAVIRKVIGQNDEFGAQTTFSTEEGLTGWVISKNKPYLIDDMEKGEYFIPRYSKEEKTNFGLRAFLGLPIASEDRVYGALTLEHRTANKYTEREKNRLQSYLNIFGTTFLRQKS